MKISSNRYKNGSKDKPNQAAKISNPNIGYLPGTHEEKAELFGYGVSQDDIDHAFDAQRARERAREAAGMNPAEMYTSVRNHIAVTLEMKLAINIARKALPCTTVEYDVDPGNIRKHDTLKKIFADLLLEAGLESISERFQIASEHCSDTESVLIVGAQFIKLQFTQFSLD